ncbi:alpha/beta fold hydrolase [Mariniflexile sp. AS56]|uniref:alpha/beta fold hydrolase n=1 Tax=Mariniflexile sp. AS56 TaxID=3063957 RepID=UPI0026EAE5FE|nr:alpha/beta hydrolase [Mariniflexile sp. AS56]MDO7170862.1 alpha/beta hydrolase [Mariniflexile sp. AS56]
MKVKKYILGFLVLALILVLRTPCVAQITDSIKFDHGYLHYHEYGSKKLPAVLILTGGPGNSYRQLEGVAEALSPKFRSILLEQRGTGKSMPQPLDATTITLEFVTNDLKTVLDSLHLKKSIIMGHSWGGMLAMNFASQYPERVAHLILVAPGPHKNAKEGFEILDSNRNHTRSFVEDQRLKVLNASIKANTADSLAINEAQKLVRRAYIYANPIPEALFQKINVENNSKTASLLLGDVFRDYNMSQSLNNYTGKIDVIVGRQDVVGFFSHELKQDVPKVKLHWVNACGHFPMYEQPRQFYKILYKTLNVR